MSRRKRRVFTQEQKAAAVEHVRSTGKTVYQAAQDLDLTETALRRWIAEAERQSRPLAAGELSVEEREELRRLLRQGELVAFELIQAEKASFPVRRMCELLEVSRSGYYSWLGRVPSKRSEEEVGLKVSIQEAHQRGRGAYGSPRVTEELKSQGLTAGRHRVARLMREQGLRGLPRRRAFRVVTTRTDPSLAVAPNTLDRNFSVPQLDQVWVSDLTYLDTQEGWLYLAAILDLGSRRIVGWAMEDNLGTQLPLRALRMVLGHRKAAKLHHSDRGCQYASTAYRSELARHGIECSMSRRGNCWDNAPMESFFSTLKRELAHRSAWQTRAQARQDIFDYIEVFYNRQRRHSALNYQTPSSFEDQLRAA